MNIRDREHRGTLEIGSALGQGTAVAVVFPKDRVAGKAAVADKAAVVEKGAEPSPKPSAIAA